MPIWQSRIWQITQTRWVQICRSFRMHIKALQSRTTPCIDNLKLGYGGTKEEMQRLLSDAEKISGIKYDISSYADVVDAIHVMQESMDIAGITAKESEGTISGSVNALKSSVTNLVVGFGDANADLDVLCENVVTAFQTVLENISAYCGKSHLSLADSNYYTA